MNGNVYYKYARSALKAGLQAIGIRKGILLPDYICASVPAVIKDLNIPIYYYSINAKFEPDWNQIEQNIRAHTIDGILGVHYFGQPFNIPKYLKICSKYDLKLIEDNAHGFGGSGFGGELGKHGSIGISSPRKFLNTYGGGVLHNNGFSSNSLQIYSNKTVKSIFYNLLQSYPNLRKILKKIKGKNLDWNDKNLYIDEILGGEYIDRDSYNIIQSQNWLNTSKIRLKNWDFLVKKYHDIAIPVWAKPEKNSNPWACPFIFQNIMERNRFLDQATMDGYEAFTWPYMGPTNTKSDLWERIACINLDI